MAFLEFRIQAGLVTWATAKRTIALWLARSGYRERRGALVYLSDVRGGGGVGSGCRFDPWRVASPRHGNCAQGGHFSNKSCIELQCTLMKISRRLHIRGCDGALSRCRRTDGK